MKLSLMLQVANVPANRFIRVKSPLLSQSSTLRNAFARKLSTYKCDKWANRSSIIDLELSIKFTAMYIKSINCSKYAELLAAFNPFTIVGDAEYFLAELEELPEDLILLIVNTNPRFALRNLLLIQTLVIFAERANQLTLMRELQNV